MAANTKGRNARGRRGDGDERPSRRDSDARGTRRDGDARGSRRDSGARDSRRDGSARGSRRDSDEQLSRRELKSRKQAKRKRKMIGILAAELVLILVLAGVVWGLSKLDKFQDLDVKADNVDMNDDIDAETAKLLKGYTNIALFGIDTRNIGELGAGNRSDTMIIASINNETKEVRLMSVYRDTYMNRADDTYGKCNAAYKNGGPKQAMEMLNTNLDLNIQYFVSVDFVALIKTIDLLGGIEVDVQEDEWEYVNSYMYETTEISEDYLDHYSPFLTGPGLQTLDGLQATSYCRIRATAGDDFRRTERQRTVLSLIADKAKTAGIGTISAIIDEVFPLVATNIPKTTMISMAASMMSYELGESSGFPSIRENGKINKQSVVVPADLEANVKALHEFLFNEADYYPSPTVIKISEKIVSDTGVTAKETDTSSGS